MLLYRRLIAAMLIGPISYVAAAGVAAADVTAAPTAGVTLDAAQVEALADAKVKPALASSGIPGVVVVVVQRDRVVLAKGYGLADVAAHRPVDAATTLFDTASIGKTMAAMVTLQLVEEG